MIDLLQVFLLSMTPIGELRLSIPMGIIIYNLNVVLVFFISIIGNLIPPIFILIFAEKLIPYFSKKFKIFEKLYKWWENNIRKKHYEKIEKYGPIGLVLFVGIPLPMTGAYTGSVLAILAKLSFKKSLLSIILGVIIAGIITTIVVMLGINIEQYAGWQVLAGILLIFGLIYWFYKK